MCRAVGACPCHVEDWRIKRRGRNTWTQSQSPHQFADNVPQTARVIAVTFVEAPGADHNGVTSSDEFYAAIDALLN